ncbi:ASPH [Symbiodinium microadriaticum]|nr:ASPH [Symbiodinium microadriaticum]
MVLDPSLFHQPDNHWHEVPNTHAGYDSSAHHWPHDRALRHRVQDVPGHAALPAETLPRHRRRAEGPWFLGPSGHPENVLVKLKEPLEPDARPLEVALPPALANLAGQLGGQQIQESDLFLGSAAFTKNESENLGIIYKWLDDIMWSQAWDLPAQRKVAYAQLKDLAEVSTLALPSLAFGVGQALYSYFWFEDNGGKIDLEAADLSVRLHDLSLQHSGCSDLSMGVGTFLSKVCHERWLFLIMLSAEVGTAFAGRRKDLVHAASMLQRANQLFSDLKEYPFFSFRRWQSLYDINTNSHVFPEGFRQRPVWPTAAVPIAVWLEENYEVFRQDLDLILNQSSFDTLYFMGHVSMTQFSGRRESWAPLNLIHNRELAPHACEVAQRSCKLLAERPEIARCHARDVGAAFARLQPGMGIKPHLWNAPPRLAVHLGLITPPGATMAVGSEELRWEEGKAVVFDERPILSSAVETRTSRAGKGGKVPEKAVPWYPEVPPNEGGAWGILGGQQPGGQEPLPADCFPALEARSLRHAIAYSNIDGQEQVHETKVTCSGEDCETMSNDVMPQIIRVRTPTKAAKPRLCTGSPFQGPGLFWDGFDNLAHRVANSARRLFGYTPAADDVRHDEIAMPPANHKSEGIMKSYVYFNNNGHEEMKQIESHCKDGTCVQRTRTFAPHSLQAVHHPVPQA